ncbi:hypothetical protein [Mesorhizobium sp. B2-3-6]|uniref:hypothetical protein n=1 Tax=Mesorhizobium sp. B2-3-6 TaxID=2589957 RepID=UPI00112E20E0|nr:hypothetical protein [Mesorhizobium sp. B2-3-6]TPM14015.1 hypothetical protein FJ953_26835 [Mesorhizobium sp. B2-3-6]
MIAFHGSPCLFQHFNAGKIGSQWRYGGSEGFGIYLTDDRDVAARYALPGAEMHVAVPQPWYGWHQNPRPNGKEAMEGVGYVYEVEIPEGRYIDNATLSAEQPEPARSIFEKGFSLLRGGGPMRGYWLHVLEGAGDNQVGKLLHYCRKAGGPLEPMLAAAGYAGCKKRVKVWDCNEFVIFDPKALHIVSVSAFRDGELFPMRAHAPFQHAWLEAAQ